MATWNDVRRLALALPETDEVVSRDKNRQWRVKEKLFVWERPLRKPDLEALGDAAPEGPLLGVRTDGLDHKEALLAHDPRPFFTIPHFQSYPAVLLRLAEVSAKDLREIIEMAWLARAPAKLAAAYREGAPAERPKKKPASGGTARGKTKAKRGGG